MVTWCEPVFARHNKWATLGICKSDGRRDDAKFYIGGGLGGSTAEGWNAVRDLT